MAGHIDAIDRMIGDAHEDAAKAGLPASRLNP